MMDVKKNLQALVVSLLLFHLSSAQCPNGCHCDELGLVSCTDLDEFPDPSDMPAGTSQLTLQNCNIDAIATVPAYDGLTNLFIVESGLQSIGVNAFSSVPDLVALVLNGNHLTTLVPASFTGLNKLTELDLKRNMITSFPNGLLSTLPALLTLDLSENKQLTFNESSFEGSHVVQLKMESCNLVEIPQAIMVEGSPISGLYLSGNKFDKLEKKSFQGLENLQQLYLGNCGLKEIHEDAFDELEKLITLDLSHNQLTSIDEDIISDSEDTLKFIQLQYNNLTKLDHEFHDYSLGLEGNPWDCNCHISWMKDIEFQQEENVTCSTPSDVRGQNVKNVTSSMQCLCGYDICADKSKLALYIAIPILIVCILLIAFYVYKIISNRKKRAKRKSVKYSSVYKDTVEATNKQQLA